MHPSDAQLGRPGYLVAGAHLDHTGEAHRVEERGYSLWISVFLGWAKPPPLAPMMSNLVTFVGNPNSITIYGRLSLEHTVKEFEGKVAWAGVRRS
jgi:hypothetical protein